MVFIDYQIQLLGIRFSKVGHEHAKESKDDINCELIALIKMHNKIYELVSIDGFRGETFDKKYFFLLYRIVDKYHEFLAFVLFVQIGQSVILFSVTLIVLITSEIGSVYFINKLIYLLVMLYEMAIFCYLGNEIHYSVCYFTESNFQNIFNLLMIYVAVFEIT